MMRALHGRNDSDGHLTNREIEIIRLIEKEMSTKEIADHLCLSEHTVETHRKNIFRKVGTQTVVGLLKYAYEHKII
jgi:DNA-binding CsgD family transcriptional regulator